MSVLLSFCAISIRWPESDNECRFAANFDEDHDTPFAPSALHRFSLPVRSSRLLSGSAPTVPFSAFCRQPRDPLVYGSVMVFTMVVAVLASLVPAGWITDTTPADVLRAE
jgi:hypothetical protein